MINLISSTRAFFGRAKHDSTLLATVPHHSGLSEARLSGNQGKKTNRSWNIEEKGFLCINWSDFNSTIVKINYDVQSTTFQAGKDLYISIQFS